MRFNDFLSRGCLKSVLYTCGEQLCLCWFIYPELYYEKDSLSLRFGGIFRGTAWFKIVFSYLFF